MFDTLSSFSVMYFILAAILILLVVFEKQCLRLEARFDAKVRKMKRAKRQKDARKIAEQNRQRTYRHKKGCCTRVLQPDFLLTKQLYKQ